MKNKHKKKRTIQIQEATKPETNSSTAETKFDAATKMQNYDFSTLYAEYRYDKICQDNKRIYGLGDLDVGLPTFEQALQTFAVDFPDDLKDNIIKTYFYKLPKCGFFMLDDACFAVIPEFAKPKFLDIYMKFRKHQINTNYKDVLIDVKVWNRTVELLSGSGEKMTDLEFKKSIVAGVIKQNEELGPKFLTEAINEYFYQGAPFGMLGLFDGTETERKEIRAIILLNFVLVQ